MSNSNLIENGRATRFGQQRGADPREARQAANRPWSVRHALRRLAAAEFDIAKPLTTEELVKKLGREGIITGAMMIAIKKFQKAVAGDVKMLQQITDDIDGKLIETIAESQITLADLVNRSYEIEGE